MPCALSGVIAAIVPATLARRIVVDRHRERSNLTRRSPDATTGSGPVTPADLVDSAPLHTVPCARFTCPLHRRSGAGFELDRRVCRTNRLGPPSTRSNRRSPAGFDD